MLDNEAHGNSSHVSFTRSKVNLLHWQFAPQIFSPWTTRTRPVILFLDNLPHGQPVFLENLSLDNSPRDNSSKYIAWTV
jgi:hypothetical protein